MPNKAMETDAKGTRGSSPTRSAGSAMYSFTLRRAALILAAAVAGPGVAIEAAATVQRTKAEAIRLYQADTGRYPTMEEGLAILTQPNAKATDGYLDRVAIDAWGRAYRYRIPGAHNVDAFDAWTYGADGIPGGCGLDRDVGNWEPVSGSKECGWSLVTLAVVASAGAVSALAAVGWRSRRWRAGSDELGT